MAAQVRSRPSQDVSHPGLDALLASLQAKIELRPIETLRPYGRQARIHPEPQLKLMEDSLLFYGFMNPVLTDEQGRVLAGNGRLQAARRIGMTHVPVVVHTHLTAMEKRAYVLMDNAASDKAGLDREILKLELDEIVLADPEFKLDMTGYTSIEIDFVRFGSGSDEDADDDIPAPRGPVISCLGDFFKLGRHRLLCGDALIMSSYKRLMFDGGARVCFTDPPYNCQLKGFATSKDHRSFPMAAGEMTHDGFVQFLSDSLHGIRESLVPGGLIYACMDWRGDFALQTAGRLQDLTHLNTIIWDKTQGGQGSFYRSQHEMVLLFKWGDAPHLNAVQLGKHGRNRSNLWSYPGFNGFRTGGRSELDAHPTPKPVTLVRDALLDSTARDDIVLDPFSGGGTTLIAAERIGRRARVMELDAGYIDLAIRRWEALTGELAIHVESGLTLEALGAARRSETAAPSTSTAVVSSPVRIRTRPTKA